jgi:hypothetical protein
MFMNNSWNNILKNSDSKFIQNKFDSYEVFEFSCKQTFKKGQRNDQNNSPILYIKSKSLLTQLFFFFDLLID